MKIFSSTKVRLTFWYVGVLALILIGFAVAAYYLFQFVLRYQTDKTLSEIAASFENTTMRELEDENNQADGGTINEAISDATVEVSFRNYKIFVFSEDKNLLSSTKTSEPDEEIPVETAHKWLTAFSTGNEANRDDYASDDDLYRVHFHPFGVREKKFFLIVIRPLDETEDLLEMVRYAFLITVPLALLLAGFGGFLLMKKSFAPIAEMSDKAEEITARNLFERLPVENEEDELGRLAKTFNRLLARLNLSFEQQRRFMADASHELRTPIAIVRGEAEVSLTKEERKSSEYRETISIMQREAERMSKIIEDLFILARADAGEEPVSKKSVYIEDILAETVKSFRSLAAKRGVEISLKTAGEMPFEADEQLLRRLFVNLLDNAVKYARSNVAISAVADKNIYKISFSDDGEGIPPESQPHIFERFYRAGKARSRQKTVSAGSGAGLGLSISQWIAEIHDGAVELAASGEKGTTFTVTFPASKI